MSFGQGNGDSVYEGDSDYYGGGDGDGDGDGVDEALTHPLADKLCDGQGVPYDGHHHQAWEGRS